MLEICPTDDRKAVLCESAEARRISNKGDKFYISSNADGSKVDHPNKRTEYFAYTLLHEIYSMLK